MWDRILEFNEHHGTVLSSMEHEYHKMAMLQVPTWWGQYYLPLTRWYESAIWK